MARSLWPWRRIPASSPELSDLLAGFDASGTRGPIDRAAVLQALEEHGNDVGRRVVEALPHRDGRIDDAAVDRILVEAHVELQRLSEEFDHGRRVADLLRPLLAVVRSARGDHPARVVEVGCGTGYVLRCLAHRKALGEGVTLEGVDFNPALVAEARSLARAERLEVAFRVGDALSSDGGAGGEATITTSTGVLHHFAPAELRSFFARQRERAVAFAHFDFQPSRLAPFGAWLFHEARFRSALAKHDGVLSALRAHDAGTLLDAARDPDGGWSVAMFGQRFGPARRVFHAVVGVQRAQREAFERTLGSRRARLGPWR